jgi:hypothetical protein
MHRAVEFMGLCAEKGKLVRRFQASFVNVSL